MTLSVSEGTPSARPILGLAGVARKSEAVLLPIGALLAGFAAFSLFLLAQGKSPADFFALVYRAGFGTAFSWENTLSRAAPLLLAALCVALPARLGLVVIGGEGAIVLGGVGAGFAGVLLYGTPALIALPIMLSTAMAIGAIWIGAVGALRHYRGVNETIASLLMAYIAIALMNHLVEGPLRDPASLNKPSTAPLDESLRVGNMPGWDVHWGLAFGVIACLLTWVLIEKTTWGFAARIAGGNARAAQVQGLPVGKLIVGFTALGGALAGL
ncbi:MAG: ABC transporter permease, partial [Pseudomonadota bacterium]